MTIKLFLLFSLTALGTVTGLFFSKKLTRRRRYFEELILLINNLISDFRFKQSSVCDLLSSFEAAEVKPTVNEFIRYVRGEDKELKISKLDLSEREYVFVKEMFSVLGTYDLETQVFVLDNYRLKAEEFYAAAKDKEARYGKTIVKLGFLLGLAAGIVLL